MMEEAKTHQGCSACKTEEVVHLKETKCIPH
jgi:hypothetical protein